MSERVGPFSKAERLATFDGRTRIGRLMSGIREALTEQVGGNPSAAQQILIHAATIKTARLVLLEETVIDHKNAAPSDQHHWLAWSNSLRRDLEALGLNNRGEQVPSLTAYIAAKAEEDAA